MASVAITTSGSRNCKELDSVANDITVLDDTARKGKNEPEKINGWKNGKHVTCH